MAADTTAGDREIVISRTFDAPRALVFKAFTDQNHLDRWWGPTDFRNTTLAMDFRVGGQWRYIMHGPDGRDYPNRIVYTLISAPDRLEYDHSEDADDASVAFQVVITFVEEQGRTTLTMRSTFPTAEARDFVVREFGAIEGGHQTLGRLALYLEELR